MRRLLLSAALLVGLIATLLAMVLGVFFLEKDRVHGPVAPVFHQASDHQGNQESGKPHGGHLTGQC